MTRLTTARVAELLKVAPRTVAAYAARGQMPRPSECPTCGHSPTWDRAELEAWRASRRYANR